MIIAALSILHSSANPIPKYTAILLYGLPVTTGIERAPGAGGEVCVQWLWEREGAKLFLQKRVTPYLL